MIEFIVVNKLPFKEITIAEIEECMNDFNKVYKKDYTYKTFDDYDDLFNKEIEKKSKKHKIYILGMSENKTKNKNEILRKIKSRNENAEIIIISKDNLSYLSKYVFKIITLNSICKLKKDLKKILRTLNSYNDKFLKIEFNINSIKYSIYTDDIKKIEKIVPEKIIVIETVNKEKFNVLVDYEYLKNKLPNNFVSIGDNILVNTDYNDSHIENKNIICVAPHTRINLSEKEKYQIVQDFNTNKINKSDLDKLNIKWETFQNWRQKFSNKEISIKIKS